MDKEIDDKIDSFFGGANIEILKFVSKDPNYKYYETSSGARMAIENDESSSEEEEVKKVEISKKIKRAQSDGNKKWWDFVKEFSKRPDMIGKSRPYIVKAAKKPYHESKLNN